MKSPTFALDGLQTDPGPFSAASDGALVEAHNVVVERPGLIEPRGPIDVYLSDATLLASNAVIHQQRYVEGLPIMTWSLTAALAWVMRRSLTTITGPTSFVKGRIQTDYVRGRFLFTSEDGVCEVPQSGTIAYRAGIPQPSCASAICTNMAPFTNWLGNNQSVAYRLTFVRRRPDGTRVESAPCAPIIVRNTSGGSLGVIVSYTPYDVNSTFDALQAGDMMNIYRGPVLNSATGTPSDVMRLRATVPIASAGLVDKLADSDWNGPFAYFNSNREGILQSRLRPTYARDVCTYNGMTVYAGYKTPMRVRVTCKAIGDIAADPQQTICSKQITGSITVGSPNITGISATDGAYIAVGQYISDAVNSNPTLASAKFPANTTIVSYNSGTGVAVASANALVTAAAGAIVVWDWIGVTDGATTYRQFAKPSTSTLGAIAPNDLLWQAAPNGTQPYGYSALETQWNIATTRVKDVLLRAVGADQVYGSPEIRNVQMLFERASMSATPFTIKSSKPNAFDMTVDRTTGIVSTQDGGDARIAISVDGIPDAVPEGNTIDIGDLSSPIYRVIPGRASVFVIKGDGVYLLYGSSPSTLSVTLLDGTVIPPRYDIAANWVTKRGDVVYMMSSRGPVAITDAGVTSIGDDIAETLRETFGVGYSVVSTFDGCASGAAPAGPYVLWSYKTASTHRTFAYNVERDAWTTWSARRPITAMCDGVNGTQMFGIGHYVGEYDDSRIAMGQPITASSQPLTGDLVPELPFATFSALGSGRYSVTIGAGSSWTPTVGDAIAQGAVFGVVTAVTSATVFEVVMNGAPVNGNVTVWEGYPIRVVWTARVLGQIAREKRYASMSLAFAMRALLLKLSAYYQTAYAPAGVQTTSQPEIVPGWSTYDTAAAESLLAAPEQITASIPLDVVRDWGLRMGFTLQQARAWFSLGAVIVDAQDGGDRVGRVRA